MFKRKMERKWGGRSPKGNIVIKNHAVSHRRDKKYLTHVTGASLLVRDIGVNSGVFQGV